jgi:hypothetical protein
LNYEQGLKPFELGDACSVLASVICERASTDENHADEFWFCRIPMMSSLRNIYAI